MTAQSDTVQRGREERFRWDEENRLTALSQNGYVSHYWYDADGERDKRTVPVSQDGSFWNTITYFMNNQTSPNNENQ